MTLKTEEIESTHNRRKFDCGEDALNKFLREIARQKHDKGEVRTYVLVEDEDDPTEIIGYYSLIPSSIEFPQGHKLKKRYDGDPPVVRLARLGVDASEQGHGLGHFLVIEALRRVVNSSLSVGGIGCVVDAKNAKVKRFYEKLGFVPIDFEEESSLALWLPISQCVDAVNLAEHGSARVELQSPDQPQAPGSMRGRGR